MNKAHILYLAHGGGPLPLLGDEAHREMVRCLRHIAGGMQKPSAILVISAHWEEETTTVTSAARPPLIYDYNGFPEESYHIRYPCPGEPALAEKTLRALRNSGIAARADEQRGFDHGVFVPLKIMYPQADMPVVQLSLDSSLKAGRHLEMGRALRALAYDNLLVIGSGFSFHNMRAFFSEETAATRAMNEAFESWLLETCGGTDMDEAHRWERLLNWEEAPYARYCHPREEHLMPLHVCYGLAGRPCSESFELRMLNKKSSMYLWRPEESM